MQGGIGIWHKLNHRVPLLWRFHNLHHIDAALDASTGFRFHFGEVLISAVFRVVQTSAIGMLFATFAACEVVFQANMLFTMAICGRRFVSSDG